MHLIVVSEFAGRLHPALVHLPIGILLLACLFELLTRSSRYATVRATIQVMVFWGMLCAIGSVITGFLLEGSGEYEEELVDTHQWAGIVAAALSLLLYILYRVNAKRNTIRISAFLVLASVFVTGHLGGNVTRGPEFLTEPFNEPSNRFVEIKPVPDIQNKVAFNDVVQPILQEGCYNCHGPKKQKGKLRFDEKQSIVKGGKSGKTLVPGKAEESEMIKRLLLPIDNDDHMPPRNKPQLTRQQISVLEWWVNTGAEFNKKVGDLKQTQNIKPALTALETGLEAPDNEITEIPDKPVGPADTSAVKKLFDNAVMVMPVARNSNYVAVSFITAAAKADSLMTYLPALKNQLVSLKLSNSNVSDSSLTVISKLTNLRKLQLENTNVTDAGIEKLKNLQELRSLNLVGTKVSVKGILQLKNCKQLKYLYLYKTEISAAEREQLKTHFPETVLDFGNYSLPMLATDTTEVDINKR